MIQGCHYYNVTRVGIFNIRKSSQSGGAWNLHVTRNIGLPSFRTSTDIQIKVPFPTRLVWPSLKWLRMRHIHTFVDEMIRRTEDSSFMDFFILSFAVLCYGTTFLKQTYFSKRILIHYLERERNWGSVLKNHNLLYIFLWNILFFLWKIVNKPTKFSFCKEFYCYFYIS